MSDDVERVLGVGAMGDVNDPEKKVTVAEQEAMIAEVFGAPAPVEAAAAPPVADPPAEPDHTDEAEHDEV